MIKWAVIVALNVVQSPAAGLSCDMSVSGAGAAFKCHVLGMLCDVRTHSNSRLLPLRHHETMLPGASLCTVLQSYIQASSM